MAPYTVQEDADAPNPTQRPASPAKRSAAIMEGIDPAPAQQDTTSNPPTDGPPSYGAHQQDSDPPATPTIEEQVTHIQSLLNTPVEDGSKGFIVASRWFNRVVARTEGADQKNFDADMLQGEIGKVDNSSVVAPGRSITVSTPGYY
jgi:ubiquitin carboxyl-terminal hydrolase 4/11/15